MHISQLVHVRQRTICMCIFSIDCREFRHREFRDVQPPAQSSSPALANILTRTLQKYRIAVATTSIMLLVDANTHTHSPSPPPPQKKHTRIQTRVTEQYCGRTQKRTHSHSQPNMFAYAKCAAASAATTHNLLCFDAKIVSFGQPTGASRTRVAGARVDGERMGGTRQQMKRACASSTPRKARSSMLARMPE